MWHEMDNEYYIVELIFENQNYFVLWYTSDTDGLVRNEDGNGIKLFNNDSSARTFADRFHYNLAGKAEIVCDEEVLLNFQKLDCHLLLDFWNMASDAANSLKISFLGDCKEDRIQSIYNKLFYGCNLPAIKKDGDDFQPEWRQEEQELIALVVKEGIAILMDSVT